MLMLNVDGDAPLFDAVSDIDSPIDYFGPVLKGGSYVSTLSSFGVLSRKAQGQVESSFGVVLARLEEVPRILDDIVVEMWRTGWNPEEGNLNLFCTDLGAIFATCLAGLDGAALVFRSKNDLSHTSVMLAEHRLEVFPFHKLRKCLTSSDGESLAQLYKSASGLSDGTT